MIQSRKHHAALPKSLCIGLTFLNYHPPHILRYLCGKLPLDDFGIFLSCGTGRGAEGMDGEVWVRREELDEALADGACAQPGSAWLIWQAWGGLACRSKDADFDLCALGGHCSSRAAEAKLGLAGG